MKLLKTVEDVQNLCYPELYDISELIFYCDDLGVDISIREYYRRLLVALMMEQEGFSGKKPFGNSGWEFDLYKCLIEHGVIEGSLDEDGFVEGCNHIVADNLLMRIAASY